MLEARHRIERIHLNTARFSDIPPLSDLAVGRLPDAVYTQVSEVTAKWCVIPTVDFIVRKPNGKFLLIKRQEGVRWPNVRWFFGGGQRRGETVRQALTRLMEAEAGIEDKHILGISSIGEPIDTYNPASEPGAERVFPASHTQMHVFIIHVCMEFEPRLDKTSSDPQWYSRGCETLELPPPVVQALKQGGLIS